MAFTFPQNRKIQMIRTKYIVFKQELSKLFKYRPECGAAVIKRNQSTQGSQLFVTLECMNNHKYSWQSQPMLEGMAAGNLLLSSSILLSGSTFTKVASLADILNLKIFKEKTFYNIQHKYLLPITNEFWLKEPNSSFSELGGQICGFQGMGAVTVLVIMQIWDIYQDWSENW